MERAGRLLPKLKLKGIMEPEDMARAAWKPAVGPRIASHSQVLSLVRDKLVVAVEDAEWQRNLCKLSGMILSNLQRELGPGMVASVEFRPAIPRRSPGRAEALRPRQDGAEFPPDEADRIADPYLKQLYITSRKRALA